MSTKELFLRRLRRLDAAGKAALRGSAARPHAPDVAAHDAFTAAWWPIRNSHLPRDACRVVAPLYFWHPKEGTGGNLVDSLRLAVYRRKLDAGQTERLVTELLAAPFAGLAVPLFEAVRRLAAAGVPINWPRLIDDLAEWDRPDGKGESVQERWAESWVQTGGKHVR